MPSGASPPCVAVRQSGIFTAVIQPPLILFVAVPGAYFLFHGGEIDGVKDMLINCGYPLIERFPLMFFTSAMVLLIGLARWYMGMSHAPCRARRKAAEPAEGRLSAVTAKISALLHATATTTTPTRAPAPPPADQAALDRPQRQGQAGRPRAPRGPAADGRPSATQPSRSRHARPPETEIIEPVAERPRRPRTGRAGPRRRQLPPPDAAPPAPHAVARSSAREPRKQPPPTSERRSPSAAQTVTAGSTASSPSNRHGTNGSNGDTGTNGASSHHPISRVRYRGADDGEQRPQYRAGRARPNTGPMPGSTTSRRL